jgi:hypothetical protein
MDQKPVGYWGLRLKENSIEMGWGTFAILGFLVSFALYTQGARLAS